MQGSLTKSVGFFPGLSCRWCFCCQNNEIWIVLFNTKIPFCIQKNITYWFFMLHDSYNWISWCFFFFSQITFFITINYIYIIYIYISINYILYYCFITITSIVNYSNFVQNMVGMIQWQKKNHTEVKVLKKIIKFLRSNH